MAHDNIEIEIKATVENLAGLISFLNQYGSFKGEKHEVDEYFSPEHNDFMSVRPVNEWLRLRQAGGKYSMDYKLWHRDKNNQSEYCDEIETGIDNIEQAKKILLALHFKLIDVVDKVRKVWVYEDYEIAIDAVKGLGDFVEVEYIGKDGLEHNQDIIARMVAFLRSTNCGKITKINTGYTMLALFPQEVEYELL